MRCFLGHAGGVLRNSLDTAIARISQFTCSPGMSPHLAFHMASELEGDLYWPVRGVDSSIRTAIQVGFDCTSSRCSNIHFTNPALMMSKRMKVTGDTSVDSQTSRAMLR